MCDTCVHLVFHVNMAAVEKVCYKWHFTLRESTEEVPAKWTLYVMQNGLSQSVLYYIIVLLCYKLYFQAALNFVSNIRICRVTFELIY